MAAITVIITTYNLKRYIDDCLNELKVQSFRDFEVLIVDDRSSDGTVERIEAFARRSAFPLRLITPPQHLGNPGKARNFALDAGQISSKYIAFLDGDDSIEKDYLKCLFALAEDSGAEIALCAYDRIEENSGRVLCREMTGFPGVIDLPPKDDIPAFMNGSLWNKLILFERIASLRVPDLRVGEDVCFGLALYERCRRIACTDRILIHYRVRSMSVIARTQEEDIRFFAEELERLYGDSGTEWRDTLGVAALIHIGVSMPFRVYGNPDVDMRRLLKRVREYLKNQYAWFHGNRFVSLRGLSQHGIRGFALWVALVCHKLHCFPLIIWMYDLMRRFLKIDIKF